MSDSQHIRNNAPSFRSPAADKKTMRHPFCIDNWPLCSSQCSDTDGSVTKDTWPTKHVPLIPEVSSGTGGRVGPEREMADPSSPAKKPLNRSSSTYGSDTVQCTVEPSYDYLQYLTNQNSFSKFWLEFNGTYTIQVISHLSGRIIIHIKI